MNSTINLLPQTLPRFHVKFDEIYSGRSFHIVNISHYCIGWNQALEYMEVLIPDSRGSPHLPIWAATMLFPLWWQHNFNLVFWPHAFASTQQCSIILIVCEDDKANPSHVIWLVSVVVFEVCPVFLIVIFILSLKKKESQLCFGQNLKQQIHSHHHSWTAKFDCTIDF